MAARYIRSALKIFREKNFVEIFRLLDRIFFNRLMPIYRFKIRTLKNSLVNHIYYDAPPHPYKNIFIHANKIQHSIGSKTIDGNTPPFQTVKSGGLSQTKGGNWDSAKYRTNIEELDKVKAIIQHFDQESEWENTDLHKYYSNKYCDDVLKKKYDNLDQLFRNIKTEGYKQRHEGNHHRPGKNQPVRDQLEVLVSIGRNGGIYFYEGKHRFGIARVLDLKIPAQVICRHKQWQEFRDKIHKNGLPNRQQKLQDHPDLQDILD